MTEGAVFSITRTPDELSIVCEESLVPEGVTCERSWRCLRVAGTMSFSMVGVLASLVQPLATAGVSAFAVSTFDTDYILVKETDLEKARQALREAQHVLSQR
ncbi:MAG: ACT domain-containing protein [Planctomycetia bacterium]|nr:ACT domain-containing protein [Planctomycetia bacterium]